MIIYFQFSFLLILFFLLLSTGHAQTSQQNKTYEAQQLIDVSKNSILQIRVIENTTNKKSSIGSGFYISSNGLIATNYHVVASVVQAPDSYHLEYLDYEGNSGSIELVDVDVVHDLAIVTTKNKSESKKPLDLAEIDAQQGEKLFAFGNPHDLGLTVVEGTNNGLLEKARNEKIHYTGSLNAGMSGGPTVNGNGEVVGINVSTAGNQISFLVPVKFLSELKNKAENEIQNPDKNFHERIEKQLFDDQQEFFSNLLKGTWPKEKIGELYLPAEINNQIKCWGNANNDEDRLIDKSVINCSTEDRIFISREFSTGQVHYSYSNVVNRDLTTIRFYEMYQAGLTPRRPRNSVSEEDVTNFKCHSDFLLIIDRSWRAHSCVRRYKKYPSLFDLVFDLTMIGEDSRGIGVVLLVSGIDQDMSQKLIARFVQEMTWQP